MKRILSTTAFIILIVAIAAVAVYALNGQPAAETAAAAPAAVPGSASVETNALAPAATTRVNVIAMPLDATEQFTSAGENFNAQGLAAIVGSGVEQVLKWNPDSSSYLAWYPPLSEGDNFDLEVGGVYRLVLGDASDIVSFVGEVPAEQSITFTLVRPESGACQTNDVSIPLDRADLTTPQLLANDVGNVEQVLQWNATAQAYLAWYPDLGEGDEFDVKIGYPYRLCLKPGGSTTWPTYYSTFAP